MNTIGRGRWPLNTAQGPTVAGGTDCPLASRANRCATALLLVGSLGMTVTAQAIGTPAGTAIDNVAQVSYQIGVTQVSGRSNPVTITVAEIVDVAVTLQSPQTPVDTGTSNQELLYTVTNTGNGSETFTLAMQSALAGDDFDPTPSSTSLFFDTDGSGDLSSGDTPYTVGTNDPVLLPDASVAILIVNDIPTGPGNGQIGQTQLTATSTTGTGIAGSLFVGAGDGGVDAIIGNSTGEAAVVGEYIVSTVTIAIVKAASISDQFNGTQPVPGATVTYSIEVTASGSGTAVAAVFSDSVPANTTYVPDSIRFNGTPVSDAPDADAGQFLTATNAVDVQLGDLSAASGTQVVEFKVVID